MSRKTKSRKTKPFHLRLIQTPPKKEKKVIAIKRILLVLLLLAIYKLSNTSGLQVKDPTTWLNETQYVKDVSSDFLVNIKSEFYAPYDNVTDLNFILHKLSHIIFYSLLAYLFFLNVKRHVGWTAFLLFLAALGDEIHQYYVVGRSGRALDVLLDVVAGLVIISIVTKLGQTKIKADKPK
ncbi:hypothetical protein CN918_25295 [Priestia megaterium]|nr:hypothetical protein CN918_25295 [Priestia megaterium]